MKVTLKFLEKHHACDEGVKWVSENGLVGMKDVDFLQKLTAHNKLQWANWLIVRVMNRSQYVSYAIFAAEQVLNVYEKKRPNDYRPRRAIEAAKKYLEVRSEKNKIAAAYAAAYAAANAAYAAADAAAYAAANAAYAAAYAAANAAADAADAAAYAADAAADAAAYAAYTATYATAYAANAAAYAANAAAYAANAAAYAAMQKKILEFGMYLLAEREK